MSDPLTTLNSKLFSGHLNTRFKAWVGTSETGPAAIELELIEVLERPTTPETECFSVFFRGPTSNLLQQRTWKLEHSQLGSMELFMTPVGQDQNGTTYEAVFNRYRQQNQNQ